MTAREKILQLQWSEIIFKLIHNYVKVSGKVFGAEEKKI